MSYHPHRRQRVIDEFVLSRRAILARVAPERYVLLHHTPYLLSLTIFSGRPSWNNITFRKTYFFIDRPDLESIFDGNGWDLDQVRDIVGVFGSTSR